MPTSRERPGGAQAWVPDDPTAASLREGLQRCRGCELHVDAIQAVPGEGGAAAPLMLIGEQPGDREDREGRPFVGPAGRLLVDAVVEAGIDPDDTYRTNVVKHFRWSGQRGSQRIHKGPSRLHIVACTPWLLAELELVRPRGVVLLGGTAGQAIYGASFRVGAARGQVRDWPTEVAGVGSGEHAAGLGRADHAPVRGAPLPRTRHRLRRPGRRPVRGRTAAAHRLIPTRAGPWSAGATPTVSPGTAGRPAVAAGDAHHLVGDHAELGVGVAGAAPQQLDGLAHGEVVRAHQDALGVPIRCRALDRGLQTGPQPRRTQRDGWREASSPDEATVSIRPPMAHGDAGGIARRDHLDHLLDHHRQSRLLLGRTHQLAAHLREERGGVRRSLIGIPCLTAGRPPTRGARSTHDPKLSPRN